MRGHAHEGSGLAIRHGRALTRTTPLNETTTFTYTGTNPRPDTVTSPSGRLTRVIYDAAQNLLTVTDPVGSVTRLTWNATGDLTTITDPVSAITRLTRTA